MGTKETQKILAGYLAMKENSLSNLPDKSEITDTRLYKIFFHFMKLIKGGKNVYLIRADNYAFLNLSEEFSENIEMASAVGSPEKMIRNVKDVLLTRMHLKEPNQEYQKMMGFFKLSHDSNKKLPALSECLELFENEKYGRHIITNRDLKAGDIVAITEPFIKLQHPGFLGRCHSCLKTNNLSLFPCRKNCPGALYCSEKCIKTAKLECCYVGCDAKDQNHLALKALIRIIGLFENVHQMINFIETSPQPIDSTVFDFDLSDENNPDFQKKLLLATLSLENGADLSLDDFADQIEACKLLVARNNSLQKMWKQHGPVLDDLLLKLMKILTLKEGIFEWSDHLIDKEVSSGLNLSIFMSTVGFGVDPYSALVNGSCMPNIRIVNVDNKNVWVVAAPIKASEQLFKSYGGEEFINSPIVERRRSLMNSFGYHCDCQACIQETPLSRHLAEKDLTYVYDIFGPLDFDNAKQRFKQDCDYINQNFEQNFPSRELCFASSMILYSLGSLAMTRLLPKD